VREEEEKSPSSRNPPDTGRKHSLDRSRPSEPRTPPRGRSDRSPSEERGYGERTPVRSAERDSDRIRDRSQEMERSRSEKSRGELFKLFLNLLIKVDCETSYSNLYKSLLTTHSGWIPSLFFNEV